LIKQFFSAILPDAEGLSIYWTILVGTEKYKLTIRNNPLSEYVISKDGQELIGYGLDAQNSKKIATFFQEGA